MKVYKVMVEGEEAYGLEAASTNEAKKEAARRSPGRYSQVYEDTDRQVTCLSCGKARRESDLLCPACWQGAVREDWALYTRGGYSVSFAPAGAVDSSSRLEADDTGRITLRCKWAVVYEGSSPCELLLAAERAGVTLSQATWAAFFSARDAVRGGKEKKFHFCD